MEASPYDAAFWERRYRAGNLAWDCGGVPGALTEFLAQHRDPGRALVPGCGSAYEIAALDAAGWDARGLDFSPAAVDRARQILGPLANRVELGDFFAHPLPAGSFDLIYERTFLCALPPATWPAYAARATELLRPGGWLCGFFFFGPEQEPPPFSIAPDELHRLLAGSFTRIADEPVRDSLPLYAGKERWQVWQRHGSIQPRGA